MPPPETALDRAEELAERVLPARGPKRRMLVIVNPYASTVSDRLKNLVVYALQGRYEVESVDTQARSHAPEICASRSRPASAWTPASSSAWTRIPTGRHASASGTSPGRRSGPSTG